MALHDTIIARKGVLAVTYLVKFMIVWVFINWFSILMYGVEIADAYRQPTPIFLLMMGAPMGILVIMRVTRLSALVPVLDRVAVWVSALGVGSIALWVAGFRITSILPSFLMAVSVSGCRSPNVFWRRTIAVVRCNSAGSYIRSR